MTRRVVIDTLRSALAARPAHAPAGMAVRRIERHGGTTLAGAAEAAVSAAFGERRR
jgi:hypothetical protein